MRPWRWTSGRSTRRTDSRGALAPQAPSATRCEYVHVSSSAASMRPKVADGACGTNALSLSAGDPVRTPAVSFWSQRMRSICVYCGSNAGADPRFAEAAALVGRRLAEEGLGLVYGGGNVGLMGIIADAVLEAGGGGAGVRPERLGGPGAAHGAPVRHGVRC